jgi:hypothetical protein
MPYTAEEKLAWEKQAYGCPKADFLASVENSLPVKLAKRVPATADTLDKSDGYGMAAMSILSDAQEMVAHGDPEGARQAINRAKLLIGDYWMRRNDAEPTGNPTATLGGWHVEASRDSKYLYVKRDGRPGQVHVKAEDEGVIVDIWSDDDALPSSSADTASALWVELEKEPG